VVDQTWGDASIAGGLADETSFARMLAAAREENPGGEIVAKLHPEVASGAKRGYLAEAAAQGADRVLSAPVNPWALLEAVDKVYTVSSQLGFEALLAGKPVVAFGMPFYAGWGLTDDRVSCPRRTRKASLLDLVHAVFFRYCRWFDAWRRTPADVFTAAEQLLFLRERFLANSRPVTGYGVTAWKRRPVRRMLDGPVQPVRYARDLDHAVQDAAGEGGAVAAWGGTARVIAGQVRRAGVPLITVEDGFLRSVGLGASFAPAVSYVFDERGIYYDPGRESDLEHILETWAFDEKLLDRARTLIERIKASGLTKYNLGPGVLEVRPPAGREAVLVPGQVADDESVRLGGAEPFTLEPLPRGGANLALIRRARARNPGAFLIYRPHPDVEGRMRSGRIPDELLVGIADHVDRGPSISAAMAAADRIETLTSLAGFEALIRGKPVTVHGGPFYAGWGLTEDLSPIPRRTRKLSLEELVAGALILYPRYLDPVSRRPCPVEVAVERLAALAAQGPGSLDRLRRVLGRTLARSRHLWRASRVAGW
jgi:capsular polysaccharide export protein